VQAWATDLASLVLWAATGRQYGGCSQTIRPCWARQEPLYQTWPVGYDGEGYWGLRGAVGSVVLIGGGCGCSASCVCSPSQVALPGPVGAVTSVQVDGVTLTSGVDYLLQGSYLVRANNLEWPASQNLSLPLGSADTWGITYTVGAAPPQALLNAAGIYACELAKARTGGQCQLPNRVQSVTRQGVEIQFVDTQDYLEKGRTGLADVDAVIAALNPHRLAAPLRVLSPDVPQFR
jgi:hypothetical protein